MKSLHCLFLCFVFFVSAANALLGRSFAKLNEKSEAGKLWAVLVAGSDGWDNYRHQSDICHAYQILHNHGIPDERIIVFMKDDLANNPENPTPGIIINHPNGEDVYKGVPHDYVQEAVTPENFMAVLRGDRKALNGVGSGKVLQSGPNDHVFVYFADHGAPGLIAFPESELSARDLNKTIKYMYDNGRYGKMVIYIEACESGSMFENLLPNNINVYATTAANGEESSYACYFDEKRETYLGDLYSVKWMEDSDQEVLTKETLYHQYKIVKEETTESHVQKFGDMKIAKMHVSEFQGRKSTVPIILPKVELNAVKSRDVPVELLRRKLMNTDSIVDRKRLEKKLNKMYRNRLFVYDVMMKIANATVPHIKDVYDMVAYHSKLTNFECYDEVRQYFNEECFQLSKNPYVLEFLYILVNLCEKYPKSQIMQAMELSCTHPPVHGIM